MINDKLLSIAIFFLGISIIMSSYLISDAIKEIDRNIYIDTRDIGKPIQSIAREIYDIKKMLKERSTEEGDHMYLTEAAKYIGIELNELIELIEEKNIDIPYLKVNNKYIFYKEALDDWLKNIEQQKFILRKK